MHRATVLPSRKVAYHDENETVQARWVQLMQIVGKELSDLSCFADCISRLSCGQCMPTWKKASERSSRAKPFTTALSI